MGAQIHRASRLTVWGAYGEPARFWHLHSAHLRPYAVAMDAINSPEYGSLTIGATAVRHSDFGDITFTLVESWGGMKWTEGYGSTPLYWMGEDIRTEPTRWTLTQGTGEGLTIGECIARDDARRRRQAKADREATMKRYGRVPWWA